MMYVTLHLSCWHFYNHIKITVFNQFSSGYENQKSIMKSLGGLIECSDHFNNRFCINFTQRKNNINEQLQVIDSLKMNS